MKTICAILVGLVLMCNECYSQNIVNYGYGFVTVPVQPKPVVVIQQPVVTVPVIQPIFVPVYYYTIVPEVRRPSWNWFQPRPVYYYIYQ